MSAAPRSSSRRRYRTRRITSTLPAAALDCTCVARECRSRWRLYALEESPMPDPDLLVFTIDTPDEEGAAFLGGTSLDIHDVADGMIFAECEQVALANATFAGLPASLDLQVHSTDGFGTFIFHE